MINGERFNRSIHSSSYVVNSAMAAAFVYIIIRLSAVLVLPLISFETIALYPSHRFSRDFKNLFID